MPGSSWCRRARAAGWRSGIIGTLVVLASLVLGGCGAVRVAYNTGPQLTWWWLDGYLDFPSAQAPQVKAAIDGWFDWHRRTQLPGYVALLTEMQAQIVEPQTAASACRWNARIIDALTPAATRAVDQASDLVPALSEAQLRHLEQRYARNLEDMRRDYLQSDAAERQAASVKRTLERAEQIYGRLDEAQRKLVTEGVAASPFDPQGWMEERRRRQREVVATLRRLLAERADRDERLKALRVLAERSQRSPDPTYGAYQQRLTDYNCAFFARLHNSTTTAQRQRARSTLKDWEDDLRSLASGGAGSGDPAAASPN